MNISAPLIHQVIQSIQNYSLTLSVGKSIQDTINKTINQLHLLEIIYTQISQKNKMKIDSQLQIIKKGIKQAGQSSGGYFGISIGNMFKNKNPQSLINIDNVWKVVGNITEQDQVEALIRDIKIAKNV